MPPHPENIDTTDILLLLNAKPPCEISWCLMPTADMFSPKSISCGKTEFNKKRTKVFAV
jgi:hypothetical protein